MKDLKNRMHKFYTSNAAYFEHMARTHDKIYFESVLRFINNEKLNLKSKRILDIGCGSGSLVKVIKEELAVNIDAYGIDISRLGDPSKVLKFKQGDVHNLPYGDKYFDVVFAVDVLEHVMEPKEVLSEAARVLKKNGYLIIRTPNILSPLIFHNKFSDILKHEIRFIFGISKGLDNMVRLDPNLKSNVIGGDEDAVSGIYFDDLRAEVKKVKMFIRESEAWGGGLGSHRELIRVLNKIPLLNILGSSTTILAKKY